MNDPRHRPGPTQPWPPAQPDQAQYPHAQHPQAQHPQAQHPQRPHHPHPQQQAFHAWPHGAPAAPRASHGLDDKTTGSLAHLCFFVFPIVGPLLLALSSTRGQPSRQMASQAAAMQIVSYVGMVVAYVVLIVAVGVLAHGMGGREVERLAPVLFSIPLGVSGLLWILGLWGSIVGAAAASRGVVWRVPLFGRLADAVLS